MDRAPDEIEILTPRLSRREKTREKVCDAAREVFLAQGYGASTIEQIAAQAGVGRSTLYTHFADKNEILQAIADDYFAQVSVVISGIAGPRPSRRQIDRWIEDFAAFALSERAATLLLISSNHMIDVPPAARAFGARIMQAYAQRLPAFQAALDDEGGVAWARATAALRELSWALVQHAEHGGGQRAANMLEVAGDLFEQLVKGWF